MFLYLLRHGLAEDAAQRDSDRRLTEEGRARLHRAAPAWQRCVGELDRIYTSPLVRAAQTAVILAGAVSHRGEPLSRPELVPDADPDDAAQLALADARGGLGAIAMVGHEPHLGRLLGRLLGSGGAIPLKKGMLVGVELESPATHIGRLVLCLSSKLAARAVG